MSLSRVLVANRGEIALRVVRACRAKGIESVLAVSEADRDSVAARSADRVVCVGPSRAAASYLSKEALVATALGTGCDAVHPGYGFLAENADFAELCIEHGLTFVGPAPDAIATMGNKLEARKIAQSAGVPIVPGSPKVATFADAPTFAEQVGYPLLIKASAGGGGRGIRVVETPEELRANFESATSEAEAAFGDGSVFMERYLRRARHIEVQVFGDAHGNLVHLGDRDCSLQRRYQKVVEEAPASDLPVRVRDALHAAAVKLGSEIGYENAGTVEFIYDTDSEEFFFLEMNTRIQVEHPVTEQIVGIDLIELQLDVAGGAPLPLQQSEVRFDGHAIECRITAEDADQGFRPSPGRVTAWEFPSRSGIRLDSHMEPGAMVPPFYDSLLGKLIVTGEDRDQAIAIMLEALQGVRVDGIATTVPFLARLIDHPAVRSGQVHTRWIEQNIGELLGT